MKNNGFTLIEMSVVLVVIGFLVGGIIVGQSMIRQSQINSAVSDEQRYVQSFLSFQQKYNALPGDLATAQTYWGTGTTCPPSYASPLTGTLTCNGDGNGQIGYGGQEILLAWEHLANAQMIKGYYTGTPGNGGTFVHVVGVNCPASKIDGAGFGINFQGLMSGDGNFFDNNYGHVIALGSPTVNDLPYVGIITALEAYNIDKKYDDGSPATGSIVALKSGSVYTSNCSTTAVSSTAAYNSGVSGLICSLVFVTGF